MQEAHAGTRLVAMDVDGTLTDGTFAYGPEGAETKRFHAHDGLAVKLLPGLGIQTALISGRASSGVRRRAAELGITEVHLAIDDKASALRDVATRLGVPLAQCAFIGDDLSDIPAMRLAGWSAAPANGAPEALEAATFVTRRDGGHGAVRDAIECLLRREGRWDEVLRQFQAQPQEEQSR